MKAPAVLTGLVFLATLLPSAAVQAQKPSTPRLDRVESKIESLEKRQEAAEKRLEPLGASVDLATKVEEAKWELLKLVLLILFGGGFALYWAVRREVQDAARRDISRILDKDMTKRLDEHRWAADARTWGLIGYTLSDIALAYPRGSPQWSMYLNAAIERYKTALQEIQKLPEDFPEKERRICLHKNNLADALIILANPEAREEAMEYARYVHERAPKYEAGFHWEDTYGWALLVFARNQQEQDEALTFLISLYAKPDLSQGWVAKRRKYLEDFLSRPKN